MKPLKHLSSIALLVVGLLVLSSTSLVRAGSGALLGSATERAASAISAGSGFNCWVESGAAKCIGGNSAGQLGDGTTTNRLSGVTVSGLSSGVLSIVAGDAHACALTTAGAMKCWGSNAKGQLGDGTTTDSLTPVQVSGLSSGVARIDADAENTCALKSTGELLCWGSNDTYGAGSVTTDANADAIADPVLVPTQVTGMSSGVIGVALGGVRTSATVYSSHGCAVTGIGEVKCWGSNANGELGSGSATPTATPVAVALGTSATGVALGTSHSCALTTAGAVKCWGLNTSGQLGNGTSTAVAAGTIVDVIGASSGVVQIAAGRSASCLISTNGSLSCWGYSTSEALRRSGGNEIISTPIVSYGLSSGIGAVSVGDSQVCVVKATGQLACWGSNANGQSGDGYEMRALSPQTVRAAAGDPSPLTGVTSLGSSLWSSCAVVSGDRVKCWGYDYYNNLGDNLGINQPVPIDDPAHTSGVASLSTSSLQGSQTHCAIMIDTTAQCWGYNGFGMRGFGSSVAADYSNRTMLASTGPDVSLTNVTSIAPAVQTTCVVAGGAAKCMGVGSSYVLGNGSTAASNLPVQVTGLTSGVTAVTISQQQSACALLSDQTIKCWGSGQNYQTGVGSLANAISPVTVSGINDATAITSGGYFHCALVTGGAVKCWGWNAFGQLGNGTTTTPTTPVFVSGITGATSVVSSFQASCAVMADTTVKCWGWNAQGMLGNGTLVDSSTPVTVTGLTGVASLSLGGAHACALMLDTTVKCWGLATQGQIGNNATPNRWFDGYTYVATGLTFSTALPTIVTTTTTSTTTTTTVAPTQSTIAPASATTVPVTTTTVPKSSVRIDNNVYQIAPPQVGGVSAFTIMHPYERGVMKPVTQTPSHCVAGGTQVVSLTPGECRVLVMSLKTGAVMRVWKTRVVAKAMSIGSTIRALAVDGYPRMVDTLPNSEYNKVLSIVKSASVVLIVGHTAIFSGNSADNMSLSGRRAFKLRTYLVKRGMAGEVDSVGVGGTAPINLKLNEEAQAANRRVRVYYVPNPALG